MDEKKWEYIEKMKQVALLHEGVDIDEIDIYSKYINAEDETSIKRQAGEIAADLQKKTYVDTVVDRKAWKPF